MGERNCTVVKGPSGFGFNLSRIADQHVFRVVDAGGAVEKAGIRMGDMIVKINGRPAGNMSHKEVVEYFKQAGPSGLQLTVRPLPELSSSSTTTTSSTASTSRASWTQASPVKTSRGSSVSVSSAYTADGGRTGLVKCDIEILKGSEGFGFNLSKKDNLNIFRVVDSNGPADRAGAAAGDIILAVGGQPITEATSHQDLVNLIRSSGSRVRMTIGKPPSAAVPQPLPSPSMHQPSNAATYAVSSARASAAAEAAKAKARTESEARKAERRDHLGRALNMIETAKMEAATALEQKLRTEEKLRQLEEQERALRQYEEDLERTEIELEKAKKLYEAKKQAAQLQHDATKAVATYKGMKDITEMLSSIEDKVAAELTSRHPSLSSEPRERRLEEKKMELDRFTVLAELEGVKEKELKKLEEESQEMRRQEEARKDEDVEKMKAARLADMKLLREKQQRMEKILQAAQQERDQLEKDKAAQRDAELQRRKQEAEDRRRRIEQEHEQNQAFEQAREAEMNRIRGRDSEAVKQAEWQEKEAQRLRDLKLKNTGKGQQQDDQPAFQLSLKRVPTAASSGGGGVHPMIAGMKAMAGTKLPDTRL